MTPIITQVPKNWTDIKKEVHALLSIVDTNYYDRVYINPVFWMDDLQNNPNRYPILSKITPALQKRLISYYLKESGRVPWTAKTSKRSKKNVWVLPNERSELI